MSLLISSNAKWINFEKLSLKFTLQLAEQTVSSLAAQLLWY